MDTEFYLLKTQFVYFFAAQEPLIYVSEINTCSVYQK